MMVMKRPRFSLKQLVVFTTVMCVLCAIPVLFGLPAVMISMLMILLLMIAITAVLLVNVVFVSIVLVVVVALGWGGESLARVFRR
jgi:hypothetical protein